MTTATDLAAAKGATGAAEIARMRPGWADQQIIDLNAKIEYAKRTGNKAQERAFRAELRALKHG